MPEELELATALSAAWLTWLARRTTALLRFMSNTYLHAIRPTASCCQLLLMATHA
jgi:hypothetical protein